MGNWQNIYQQGRQLNKYPYDAIVSLVMRLKRTNSSLSALELGCGAGNNIVFMAEEGVDVAGIDISSAALDFAQERLTRLQLKADLVNGHFTQLPWQDNSFDLVIDRSALNCVPRSDILVALSESYRVLKPGGCIFSIMYADAHPAFINSEYQHDGFARQFSPDYLSDIDGLFFASKADVCELFSKFTITQQSYDVSYDQNDKITSAQRSIVAYK
jgi:ubiquinone/menaquinone biosynthesis C-methylase UbiE